MKKILILANSSGGLVHFRKELITELRKKYKIFISTPANDSYELLSSELGCKVIRTEMDRRGINPVSDFVLFRTYQKLIKQIRPDYVITYTIKPDIYGGAACRLMKVPYAVNITGLGTAFQNEGLLKKAVIEMYKFSCKNANVVFFENIENRQVFLECGIISEQQSCLLNGAGVNLDHFALLPYPADDSEVHFLFVGRVMREKGINELFKAMRMLRKEGRRCVLHVVGGFEEDYKDVVQRFEKEGWLKYHGFQEDVRPFIEQAHCFVLPSWHEGMANTNLENASCGRPVITTNIHGCLEAVVPDKSGFLCEKQNVQSLLSAMKKFLDLSYDEKKKMGEEGRRHVEEVFDKKKVVAETIKAMDQLSRV